MTHQTMATGRISRFRVEEFVYRVATDLRPYISEDSYASIILALRDPVSVRPLIRDLLETAEHSSIATVAALRQLDACVSKLPGWGGSSDTQLRTSSLASFLDSEKSCKRANKRIAYYAKHPLRLSDSVRIVIGEAQTWIYKALGGPPDPGMFDNCDFGPGLTYGLPADLRHLYHKVDQHQTVTPGARRLALDVLSSRFPAWFEHLANANRELRLTPGNRVTFVPKSAKSLRTIAIEPSLNVFLQKAVDTWLKKRLRNFGLRLRDQNYSVDLIVNEAQKHLGVATIDLSAASDSIAIETVRQLFPKEWFELLDTIRSQQFTTDKGLTWTPYSKFSSMGNATTFPVESMIFYALAYGCCRVAGADIGRLRTYGDDIIIPPECAGLLIEVLKHFGFATNTDKTFIFGRFRETCGVDLLEGVDIRPVYVRSLPTTPPQVANLFNRLLTNRFGFPLERTLAWLLTLVDKPFFGPAFHGWSGVRNLCDSPWEDWYEGRNTLCDAYFFSPRFGIPTWSESYQCRKWTLHRWYYQRRPLRGGPFSESALLRCFLLGMENGVPVTLDPRLKVRRETFYGEWPDLPWWPDIYNGSEPSGFGWAWMLGQLEERARPRVSLEYC